MRQPQTTSDLNTNNKIGLEDIIVKLKEKMELGGGRQRPREGKISLEERPSQEQMQVRVKPKGLSKTG